MAEQIQQYYLNKLKEEHAFWSYDQSLTDNFDSKKLIENILIHLDMDDIILMFQYYPKKLVQKVWLEKLVRQEPMYHNLNRMIAMLFFKIKNPDRYLLMSKQRILKSLSLCRD